MMKFLGVIILAGTIILGAYFFFRNGSQVGPVGNPDAPENPTGGFSLSGNPGEGEDPNPVGLSAELQQVLADTDAAWQALVDAGQDPTVNAQTSALTKAYSRVLRGTYNKPALKELQQRLVTLLTPVGAKLFLDATAFPEDPTGLLVRYTIQKGDRFDTLGKKFGLSREHINLLRGRDTKDENYRDGEVIKLVDTLQHGGFALHMDLDDFYMDLFIGGVFTRRFSIGHGREGKETPTGTTIINERFRDPQWTDPESGKVYHVGDPQHLIGRVWLQFRDYGARTGLGIHGYTGEGQATGAKVSNGCIRMKNDEAELLWNVMVPVGTFKTEGFVSRSPMNVEIVE